MEDKEILRLVDKFLINEFENIQKNNEEGIKELDEIFIAENKILEELNKGLSKEQILTIGKILDKETERLNILCEYYFKQGIVATLDNLKFLNEFEFIRDSLISSSNLKF